MSRRGTGRELGLQMGVAFAEGSLSRQHGGADPDPLSARFTPTAYLEDRTVIYYKVLVAGEVGVGKSALVATLANVLGGETPTESFDEGNTLVLTFAPTEARRHRPLTVLCTLVDSPAQPTGGGSSAPGLRPPLPAQVVADDADAHRVREYVEQSIERYWSATDAAHAGLQGMPPLPGGGGGGGGAAGALAGGAFAPGDFDSRVDVVLYLLPPRRLSPWDRQALQQLSAMACVIPVVARADSLSRGQATRLRAQLAQELRQAGVALMDPLLQAEGSVLAAHKCDLPLVVGSGDLIEAGNAVRRYSWGTFKPALPEHSDLALLRALLFSEATILALKHQTENFFTMYKRRTPAADAATGGRGRGRVGAPLGAVLAQVWGMAALRLLFVAGASLLLLLSAVRLLHVLTPPIQRDGGGDDGSLPVDLGGDAEAEAEAGLGGAADDVSHASYQLTMLDHYDPTSGGMHEVVLGPQARYLTFTMTPDLMQSSAEAEQRKGVDCSPRIMALPVHSSLYQTVNGLHPDYRQEVTQAGTAVLHEAGRCDNTPLYSPLNHRPCHVACEDERFVYVPPRNKRSKQACGVTGCWDQFAVTLPCGPVTETEDSPTLTVRVVEPPPQNVTFALMPTETPEDLVAGNVDVAMEWIQVHHLSELAELGYTQAEIHVFLLGPGRLKLNLHDVPQLGKRMVEATRELPHSVFAFGTLEGLALVLPSITYRHPGVAKGADEVVATLTTWAPKSDGRMLVAQVRARVRIESTCSPASATIGGTGLVLGPVLTAAEVTVACEHKNGGDNITVVVQSADFLQTIVAQEHEGSYTVQYIRPSEAYRVEVYVNGLAMPDNPYRIEDQVGKAGKKAGKKGGHATTAAITGVGAGNVDGTGSLYDSSYLPQSDKPAAQGTSGKEIYGSKDPFSGLMEAMGSLETGSAATIRNRVMKRGGGLRGEGSLVAMLAKSAGANQLGAAASGAYMSTDNGGSAGLGGGTRLGTGAGGALPLPKFDANGHVIGEGVPLVGTSKLASRGDKKASVPHIGANDIRGEKDVLEGLGVFGGGDTLMDAASAAVNRPKLSRPKVRPQQASKAQTLVSKPDASLQEEATTSKQPAAGGGGTWITGPNALERGSSLLMTAEDLE